jgi:hypothetical protein
MKNRKELEKEIEVLCTKIYNDKNTELFNTLKNDLMNKNIDELLYIT